MSVLVIGICIGIVIGVVVDRVLLKAAGTLYRNGWR